MRIEPGRVAVVTGGASGIGYALGAAAAGRGLHVVLSDARAGALEAAAAELRGPGAAVTPVAADVSKLADIDRLAKAAFALGPVQLVCSNAGIVVTGRAWELTAADWERAARPVRVAQPRAGRAAPRVRGRGDGAAPGRGEPLVLRALPPEVLGCWSADRVVASVTVLGSRRRALSRRLKHWCPSWPGLQGPC